MREAGACLAKLCLYARPLASFWDERFHGNNDDDAEVYDAKICGKYH